jgi:hypothetical protein
MEKMRIDFLLKVFLLVFIVLGFNYIELNSFSQIQGHSVFITGKSLKLTGKQTVGASFQVVASNNTAPSFDKIFNNLTINANSTYTLLLTNHFSDVNEDSLTFSASGDNNITINIDGSISTITPDPGFIGTQYFQFTANDGTDTTKSNNISITLLNNNPPVQSTNISDLNITSGRQKNLNLSLYFTDQNQDSLNYSILSLPQNITIIINNNTGITTLYSESDFSGNRSIQFLFNDSVSGNISNNFTLEIIPELPPVITTAPVTSATEGSSYIYQVKTKDNNEDQVTYFDNTSLFNINEYTGLIQFTPSENGTFNMKIIAMDSTGRATAQNFSLEISAFNDPPDLEFMGLITLEEGVNRTYSIPASDEEYDPLTYNVTGVSFASISDSVITFAPGLSDSGNYTINISVSDGTSEKSENVSLTVLDSLNVNDAPSIDSFAPSSINLSFGEHQNITFNVTVSDPDGTTPSISWFLNGVRVSTSNNYTFIGNFTVEGSNAGLYFLRVNVSDNLAAPVTNLWQFEINRSKDSDRDGIPDINDNCPLYGSDTDQTDSDGDNIGDVCDDDDLDDDGINDSADFLIGNISHIDSNVPLVMEINQNPNLSVRYNETQQVRIFSKKTISDQLVNVPIIDISFPFNSSILDLTKVSIKESVSNNSGEIIVNGLNLSKGVTKTLSLDIINPDKNYVCIEDRDVASISFVSEACDQDPEVQIKCDGSSQFGITCTENQSTKKYVISNLNFSAAKQISVTASTSQVSASPTQPVTTSPSSRKGRRTSFVIPEKPDLTPPQNVSEELDEIIKVEKTIPPNVEIPYKYTKEEIPIWILAIFLLTIAYLSILMVSPKLKKEQKMFLEELKIVVKALNKKKSKSSKKSRKKAPTSRKKPKKKRAKKR